MLKQDQEEIERILKEREYWLTCGDTDEFVTRRIKNCDNRLKLLRRACKAELKKK